MSSSVPPCWICLGDLAASGLDANTVKGVVRYPCTPTLVLTCQTIWAGSCRNSEDGDDRQRAASRQNHGNPVAAPRIPGRSTFPGRPTIYRRTDELASDGTESVLLAGRPV